MRDELSSWMSSLLSVMASFCTDKTRTRWKGSDQIIQVFMWEMNCPREHPARRVGKEHWALSRTICQNWEKVKNLLNYFLNTVLHYRTINLARNLDHLLRIEFDFFRFLSVIKGPACYVEMYSSLKEYKRNVYKELQSKGFIIVQSFAKFGL